MSRPSAQQDNVSEIAIAVVMISPAHVVGLIGLNYANVTDFVQSLNQ